MIEEQNITNVQFNWQWTVAQSGGKTTQPFFGILGWEIQK
jgi:hypothetical protein